MLNDLEDREIDYKKLEKVFTNYEHYKAMKNIPVKQKQVLYLLIVKGYTNEEVAQMLNTTKEEIEKLKEKAILNFRKNWEEKNGK